MQLDDSQRGTEMGVYVSQREGNEVAGWTERALASGNLHRESYTNEKLLEPGCKSASERQRHTHTHSPDC